MPPPQWSDETLHKLLALLATNKNGTNYTVQSIAELREMMTNHSLHVDHEDFDLLRSPAWRALIITLYLLVIVIGVIGNSLVVYVVAKHRQLQNITNVFIANLAISDIGLCVFSLPIQLHYQLTDHWIFGAGLCRVVFSAFAMPMYVSTITIMLIAFDRYWIIVYPLRRRMTFCFAMILIVITAIVSLLLSIPVMYFTTLHTVNDTALDIYRSYCIELWPIVPARITYSVLMFFFQFFFPLLITAIIYHRIYSKLSRRNSRRSDTERKNRTNKILLAIVVVFAVCWLPWNLFSLITEFQHQIVRGRHFKFLDLLLKLFAMSSACVNPFLYCWLNDNFRREVDSIVVKFKRRASGRIHSRQTPQVTYDLAPSTTTRRNGRPSLTTTNHLTVTIMVDQGSTSQALPSNYHTQSHLLVPHKRMENSVMDISAAEPSDLDAQDVGEDLDITSTQQAAAESQKLSHRAPIVVRNCQRSMCYTDPLSDDTQTMNGVVGNYINHKNKAQIPCVTVYVAENESESSGQELQLQFPDKPIPRNSPEK